jgi:hypothetical protein
LPTIMGPSVPSAQAAAQALPRRKTIWRVIL